MAWFAYFLCPTIKNLIPFRIQFHSESKDHKLVIERLLWQCPSPSTKWRRGHTTQHCPQHRAQLESYIVCPPLKLLRATLHATVAEVESASTSATSYATVSPCVHHSATLRATLWRKSYAQCCIVCPRLEFIYSLIYFYVHVEKKMAIKKWHFFIATSQFSTKHRHILWN